MGTAVGQAAKGKTLQEGICRAGAPDANSLIWFAVCDRHGDPQPIRRHTFVVLRAAVREPARRPKKP